MVQNKGAERPCQKSAKLSLGSIRLGDGGRSVDCNMALVVCNVTPKSGCWLIAGKSGELESHGSPVKSSLINAGFSLSQGFKSKYVPAQPVWLGGLLHDI